MYGTLDLKNEGQHMDFDYTRVHEIRYTYFDKYRGKKNYRGLTLSGLQVIFIFNYLTL